MKNINILIISIGVSVLCFFGAIFLGSINLASRLFGGASLYFCVTLVLLRRFPAFHFWILIILSMPLILILFFINVLDFERAWISLPSNLFFLIGCLSGYYFHKKRNFLIPVLLIVSMILWQFIGNQMLVNKFYYGSFDQNVLTNMPIVNLCDSNHVEVSLHNSKKILILDFWNSHCGPCYRQFPMIDSMSKKIDNNKFDLRIVNVPLNGEKKEDNFRLLNRYNYHVNQLFSNNDSILDVLKISVFPTTLVIKNNQIIFKGEFENALKMIKTL